MTVNSDDPGNPPPPPDEDNTSAGTAETLRSIASNPTRLPTTADVLRALSELGAQQAFQLDPKLIKSLGDVALPHVPVPDLMTSEAIIQLKESVNFAAADIRPAFDYFEITRRSLADSVSVAALYNHLIRTPPPAAPRQNRDPQDFFNERAVDISSKKDLLKAFAAVQEKQSRHRPIWRGQVNSTWAVHSSLYRRLESQPVTEDRLVEAEIAGLDWAGEWDIPTSQALRFLADLQHNGAPTRLMDVTTDPEIAAWFAVEEDETNEHEAGLVIGWGRSPILKTGVAAVSSDRPTDSPKPYWHPWKSSEQRIRVDWGTGTKTWTWFPPALNERMRAQRAGFLLEAGAILSDEVVQVFSDALSKDWLASEITRATSVIGLPSRHDVLTKPNDANLVPLFVFRIAPEAKPEIRTYLETKGLRTSSIYPDLPGLVSFLRGPFGPGLAQSIQPFA